MSGQETLNSVNDTLTSMIFSASGLPAGLSNLEPGPSMLEKAFVTPPTWFFIYLYLLLGIFAWARLNYGNSLLQIIQASTNFQVATRMFKDNSLLQKQLDNVLHGFYFLSVAFLLFLGERWLGLEPYDLNGGGLYLFNLLLLLGVFFGRIILVNLSGFLFNQLRVFREYLYNAFIFNKLLGIVVLPLLLFLVYTSGVVQDIFYWITAAVLVVVMVMRVIRGVVYSFKKDILIFYMFLYLCALELIPLALLYKWLEGIL